MQAFDLSAPASSMPRSGIRAFMDLAWTAGDVIHLEVGEPNFPTPPHIVEAAARAARNGQTKYVANAGVAELREAIADKIRRSNGYVASRDDVVVTAGGVQALYLSMLALVEPGDGVLVPDPGWPNFRMIATLLNGVVQPYRLRAAQEYQPCIEDLDAATTSSTKVLILNSPSNPLGSVMTAARISEILEWSRDRGIWIISDECYDEIVFDESFVSPRSLGSPENVIACYSFSKTYSMTGWRVGYAVAGRADVRDSLAKLQEPLISCVSAPVQAAAVAALRGPQEVVTDMRDAYLARRDAAVLALRSAKKVDVLVPSGAFYLWLDTSPWVADDWALATAMLDQAGVAVAPGSAFGAGGAGFVRISLATEMPVLLDGIGRILAFLDSTRQQAAG
ncbi:MAG TPA: aminotransferase class I/II-fold pyridoxal phosphate-dependent enzyme [Streptosporangiaceae bacterium]|nr:aminotransferase class I/II-fold pyridoxal phosphate-dependent enzyme [Streptosporangiaceae bacterium]